MVEARVSGPMILRNNPQMLRLEGEECEKCHAKIFPPRDICPECGEQGVPLYILNGHGDIYRASRRESSDRDIQEQGLEAPDSELPSQ